MSAEPTFRRAGPEDSGELARMLRRSLGPGMTEELWRWKHLESPFGPSPVLLAEAGGRIVGVRAFLRWRFRSGDREVPAVRAVDTATHPEWRRRGLFSELTRRLAASAAEEGAAFVYNTPNRVSRRGYLRLGWERVARVPIWVRARPVRALARRLAAGGAPEPEPLAARFPRVAELLAEPELSALLAAGEALPERRYRTPRAVPYLTWRYRDAPGLDYFAAWRFTGGRGAAVVFRRRRRRGLDQLVVSEVLASGREAADTLAAELLREVAAGAGLAAAVAAPGSPAAAALGSARFVPVPGLGPLLTARRLAGTGEAGDPPDPLRWASWCCSLGDLEVF